MEFILDLLKQDYISNVYIGVTGILVAIVIFIAEVIKDQNNELNKKVILHKTNIKNYVIDVLLIFLYMLIVNMLKYNEENSICEFYNIIYVITHILLLEFVILSIYRTGKIFWITLKLNTEKDYFNKELEKYINEKKFEDAAHYVHRVKGAARQLAMEKLAQTAQKLEDVLREKNIGEVQELQKLIDDFCECYAESLKTIQKEAG